MSTDNDIERAMREYGLAYNTNTQFQSEKRNKNYEETIAFQTTTKNNLKERTDNIMNTNNTNTASNVPANGSTKAPDADNLQALISEAVAKATIAALAPKQMTNEELVAKLREEFATSMKANNEALIAALAPKQKTWKDRSLDGAVIAGGIIVGAGVVAGVTALVAK